MKNTNYKMIFVCFITLFFISKIKAQDKKIKLGLNYGLASQKNIFLNNENYSYENTYLKVQVNYLLSQKRKFDFEIHLEPSLYFSKHQLLNKYYIEPQKHDNYLELRERYLKEKNFLEYALNVGFITRYKILNNFSTYVLGSVGPMIANKGTERLKKGFSFSDIFALGFSYKQKRINFDLRFVARHNSNANIQKPNSGHNSLGIESGISFQL